ncbi:MAG: T9SS C-terminal target domain-containing protein [Ignavibacteriales bacterium]|nr:MAG: T9SS C-terminal target domain-containing protein [Ignavibacteriales bacterium]
MKVFLTIFFILFSLNICAQNYKQVKIYLQDRESVKQLLQMGLEFDHHERTKDNAIIIFLSDAEFSILQSSGFNYEIIIDDWFDHFIKRQKLTEEEKKGFIEQSKREFNVSGFGFGSMAGFYTFSEMVAELDTMRILFPDLVTEKQSIGNTVENRPMYMVKISDNPEVSENEPKALYTAMHHAREPQSMMQLIYFMYYLLENYNLDPSVQYLVNNRELYFIPVVNPDGYEYNRQTNPNGGGFWRKNRRNNGGSFGIDLNRNYGPMAYWNAPNGGSSTSPGSDTYRGTAPFSEPETTNLKNFLAGRNIKNILNYHTYGNWLIFPYGALETETPDSLIFREFAGDMTSYNGYVYGTDLQTVDYSTRGNSDDYAYDGDIPLNGGKIFAMTPEVGNSSDGFWPQQSRIFPLAQENLLPNMYYAWVAGGYASLKNANFQQQHFLPGNMVEFYPQIKNKGLSTVYNIAVEVTSLSTFTAAGSEVVQVDSIPSQEVITLQSPLSFTISPGTPVEEKIKLLITVKSDDIKMSEDTVSIIIGIPNYIFADTSNNPLNLWTITSNPSNPKWEATTTTFYSSPTSYTDSKSGSYSNNATVTMTLTNPIDLSSYQNPILKFFTKYDIESDWDYGQVEISTNNGSTWIPLQGNYTQPGSGNFQPSGQPVYDGIQHNWVPEEISLAGYSSNQVKIRFELKSDGFQTRDGWYVDDIGIIVYSIVPVELTSFTANLNDDRITLNWSTASELNNYGFEIEKKQDIKGGWYTVGFVAGKGTTEEVTNYSFTDKAPAAGKTFYRLKQVDFNGSYDYSDVVAVNYSGVTEYDLSQNYPNPFNPVTVINYSIPNSGKVSLKICNILGVEVAELVNEYKEAGRHAVEFSTEMLKREMGSGVYFYRLTSGNFVQTRKMMVIK